MYGSQAQEPVGARPERLHEEITADYNDMIYAATRQEIEVRRKAFIRKWRLKHRAAAARSCVATAFKLVFELGDPAGRIQPRNKVVRTRR